MWKIEKVDFWAKMAYFSIKKAIFYDFYQFLKIKSYFLDQIGYLKQIKAHKLTKYAFLDQNPHFSRNLPLTNWKLVKGIWNFNKVGLKIIENLLSKCHVFTWVNSSVVICYSPICSILSIWLELDISNLWLCVFKFVSIFTLFSPKMPFLTHF